MGRAKNNKRDELGVNTTVNQDIKQTLVGIYMANLSTRN